MLSWLNFIKTQIYDLFWFQIVFFKTYLGKFLREIKDNLSNNQWEQNSIETNVQESCKITIFARILKDLAREPLVLKRVLTQQALVPVNPKMEELLHFVTSYQIGSKLDEWRSCWNDTFCLTQWHHNPPLHSKSTVPQRSNWSHLYVTSTASDLH